MPTESESEVEEMQRVRTDDGDTAPPASDAEAHVAKTDIDINNGGAGVTVAVTGPSRAQQMALHVQPDTDAEIRVHFLDAEGGTRITSRTPTENSDYATTGGADIYGMVTALPSRFIEIEIEDTSGNANTADYQFRVI